jgi:hypothetical protein
MDDVGKFDGILDKEHRNVVADEIEVSLAGVELDGKPAYIAGGIHRALAAGDRREADEDRRLFSRVLQEGCFGQFGV